MKQKFLLFALVALILVFPAHQAQAATFWDGLGTALQKIVTGATDIFSIPYAIALQIIQAITGILPLVAGELFRVALNFNEKISLIPSAGAQDMVTIGFQFTRDIANMLFILILAWIGFATILRLKSYEIKEIVPKLVMIALLINFIPVIAGVILDIASIVTKIFAEKSTNIALYIWQLLPGVSMIQGGTTNLTAIIPGNGGISGMAVASLMGIVFNLIAFFMLVLYALIFIMRIVAIWILIVLAPLAWLGYIIPQGKKMWDMWWKQFIQWAIIGIPLTFFLYLSTFVLSKSSFQCELIEGPNFEQYNVASAVLSGFINKDLICSALPFLAGVIVMLIGFILSITLSPKGADTVIKQAKRGGLVAGKVLETQSWQATKKIAGAQVKAPFRFARGFGQYMRGRRPGQLTQGTEQPISPGLMMEEGMDVEEMRQNYRRPSGINKIRGAISAGVEEARLRDFKGKAQAAKKGTRKAITDSVKAGWGAAWGKKKPKKKFKTADGSTIELEEVEEKEEEKKEGEKK